MSIISILIPLYNKEKYIQKSIESILNQTYQDFEIIIINDGSTDNSLQIVEQFTDERIHVYTQKNTGVAAARNKGITESKGKLLCFLDADDYWLSNHLEEIFKLYEENENCGMFCSRYSIQIAENKFEKISFKNEISDDFKGVIPNFFKASLINRIATSSTIGVKKEVFDTVGHFNTNYTIGEDTDMWIRIAINYKAAITNVVTSVYNFDTNNVSKTSINNHLLSDFKEFNSVENKNNSLKKFLDVYRIEYALKYRIVGNTEKSKDYLKEVDEDSITKTTQLLFLLPPKILQLLLKVKHIARKNGFNFSVYN